MLTTIQLRDKACTLAARAHHGQLRKDSSPYFCHVVRVALRCKTDDQIIVALMHDLIEDCGITTQDLRDSGFPNHIVDAVDALSRRPGEQYHDFIVRCNKNELARPVKIADIADNLEDQSALDIEEAAFLKKRYERALTILKGE